MENIKLIDKYQIYFAHFLGKGSYASVYMAKNVETGEQVAVKIIERNLFMYSYNLKCIQSEI